MFEQASAVSAVSHPHLGAAEVPYTQARGWNLLNIHYLYRVIMQLNIFIWLLFDMVAYLAITK